jgi:2-polyprenyl-3-methyl-5-hydroxy-6-metoxy-1,4-benzoquinol methylase
MSDSPSQPEIWEATFGKSQLMWGMEPTRSAVLAADFFARVGAKRVLIPGVGYGRNAKAFLEQGMSVTGIEISETAIGLAREQLGLDFDIHHGSVEHMPFDSKQYDGIFCYGLIYLLDAAARAKLIRDCQSQLVPGGHMIFTVISKQAPMYGRGARLGEDWYEPHPGIKMFFYDHASIQRELGPHGLTEIAEVLEPQAHGVPLPFLTVTCRRPA